MTKHHPLSNMEMTELFQQQLFQGFSKLSFTEELEDDFQTYLAQLIKRRIISVASFCFVLLSLYAFMDFIFLPDRVWQFTIQVRLAMLIPMPFLGYLILNNSANAKAIIYSTLASYLWMGTGVIIIIAGSQLEGFNLPYDGLYSVLLFGFFLLGLPFRLILISTWGMWLLYGLVEIVVGHTELLLPQLFFLASMCSIGMVGSYLQEHTLRTGYLKHQLIKLGRQQAIADREAKTRFLAAAGHDLRQPINAINLISEALAQTSDKQVSEAQHKMMTDQLSHSVDMLNRLLDSLLEYSKLEMGEVTPHVENVSVDALLDSLSKGLSPQLKAAGIELKVENVTSITTKTDYLLLERILRNLITNAIQHANASQISLLVSKPYSSNKQNLFAIKIEDNGCGISEQHIEAIFDQYYQVTPNREKGMGLGLSIVKQLTNLLDIELSVTSTPEQGTCFTLILREANTKKTAQKEPLIEV